MCDNNVKKQLELCELQEKYVKEMKEKTNLKISKLQLDYEDELNEKLDNLKKENIQKCNDQRDEFLNQLKTINDDVDHSDIFTQNRIAGKCLQTLMSTELESINELDDKSDILKEEYNRKIAIQTKLLEENCANNIVKLMKTTSILELNSYYNFLISDQNLD